MVPSLIGRCDFVLSRIGRPWRTISYPRVMHSAEERVWYASYGSNCDLSRFMLYLEGGRRAGTNGNHLGARNPSPPLDSAPLEFSTQVTFTGVSKRWGGGVAFLEHRRRSDTPGALGRRYLITREQFDDVVAQESRRPTTVVNVDGLDPGELRVIGSGSYDALLALQPVDGIPVITFTSPNPPENRDAAVPSVDYLTTIATGLRQVHRIGAELIVERLRLVPIIASNWSKRELLDVVAGTDGGAPRPNGPNDS